MNDDIKAIRERLAAHRWGVMDPHDGLDVYDEEAEAQAAFDRLVDALRDESSDDGWAEDAESCALYRMEPVLRLRLEICARSDDDTEDGQRCRYAGWDYLARGVVDEVSSTDLAALCDELEVWREVGKALGVDGPAAALVEVLRLRALLRWREGEVPRG